MDKLFVKSDESITSQNKRVSLDQHDSMNQTSLTDELKEIIHQQLEKHHNTLIKLAKY